MKSTGIVRRLDDLGRFVVPMELRRLLQLGDRAQLEIFVEGDTILLKRHQPACVFCGVGEDLVEFRGQSVCRECRWQLVRSAAEAGDDAGK